MSVNRRLGHDQVPGGPLHLSPDELVRLRREKCTDVGRIYKVWSEVWNNDQKPVYVGYLELILQQLEMLTCNIGRSGEVDAALEAHRDWLNYGLEKMREYDREIQSELRRISQFCDLDLLSADNHRPYFNYERHVRRLAHRTGKYDQWDEACAQYIARIRRLRSVRSLDDIDKLNGIGKVRKARIIEKMKERRSLKVDVDSTQEN